MAKSRLGRRHASPERKKRKASKHALGGGAIPFSEIKAWVDALVSGAELQLSPMAAELKRSKVEAHSSAGDVGREIAEFARKTEDGGEFSRDNVMRAINLRRTCGEDGAQESIARLATDNFLIRAYMYWVNFPNAKRITMEAEIMRFTHSQGNAMFTEERAVCGAQEERLQQLDALKETVQDLSTKLEEARRDMEAYAAQKPALEAKVASQAQNFAASRIAWAAKLQRKVAELMQAREAAAAAQAAKEAEIASLRTAQAILKSAHDADIDGRQAAENRVQALEASAGDKERALKSLQASLQSQEALTRTKEVQLAGLSAELSRSQDETRRRDELLRNAEARHSTALAASKEFAVRKAEESQEDMRRKLVEAQAACESAVGRQKQAMEARVKELSTASAALQRRVTELTGELSRAQSEERALQERCSAESAKVREEGLKNAKLFQEAAESVRSAKASKDEAAESARTARAAKEEAAESVRSAKAAKDEAAGLRLALKAKEVFVKQSEDAQRELVSKLKAAVDKAKSDLAASQRETEEVRGRMSATLAEMARNNQEHKAAIEDNQSKLHACEDKLAKALRKLAESKGKFEVIERNLRAEHLQALETAKAEHMQSLEAAKEENAAAAEKSFQKRFSEQSKAFSVRLDEAVQAKLEEVNKLQGTLRDLSTRLETARQGKEAAEATLESGRAALRELQAQFESMQEAARVVISGVQQVRRASNNNRPTINLGAWNPSFANVLPSILPGLGFGESFASAKLGKLEAYTHTLTYEIDNMLPSMEQLMKLRPYDTAEASRDFIRDALGKGPSSGAGGGGEPEDGDDENRDE